MRHVYAHDAVLDLPADGDERAPGGAVTMALCGSLEHPPPCPHAPHQTSVERAGRRLRVRIVFATDDEADARRTLEAALATGEFTGPDGGATRWTVVSSEPADLVDAEHSLGERLVVS
jgi:hypothetical protein